MGFFVVLGLIGLALAQYRPPQSELNLTTIKSPLDGNITITYKSPPPSICETAYDWQNQYTGWVNIPGDYPSNTFFWFIEAREPTEQVTLWLNGGPGSSSMVGMWQENGPCEVVDDGMGGWKTRARAWGWDRGSHLVFVDQVCLRFHLGTDWMREKDADEGNSQTRLDSVMMSQRSLRSIF